MYDEKNEWLSAKKELVNAVSGLGFSRELGEGIAKNLRGTKAMARMTSYLYQVKPRSEELVVDEMLAIMSEIDIWRRKKESQEANASYNEMLEYGLNEDCSDDD